MSFINMYLFVEIHRNIFPYSILPGNASNTLACRVKNKRRFYSSMHPFSAQLGRACHAGSVLAVNMGAEIKTDTPRSQCVAGLTNLERGHS